MHDLQANTTTAPTHDINAAAHEMPNAAIANEAHAPFSLDGSRFSSVLAFEAAILFPHSHQCRHTIMEDTPSPEGLEAMAQERMNLEPLHKLVWWNHREIPFRSEAHMALVERAIIAKFSANAGHMAHLRSTVGLRLVSSAGREPYQALDPQVFCNVLTRIRHNRVERWSRGTLEHPVKVTVVPEQMSDRWTAKAVHRGELVYVVPGATRDEAVGNIVQKLANAHPETVIAFTF